MQVLPAIDLLDGNVVRLERGEYDSRTVYSDAPAAVAGELAAAGAKWIHVVDLNAARSGQRENAGAVRAIAQAGEVKIELGGGARDERTIEAMLADGVARVVIGSAALTNWSWFESLLRRTDLAGKIALGLDARDGQLSLHGWTQQAELTALELARRVSGSGLAVIVYTDITRDGMLTGVNIDATAELVAATDVPVIASGGVGSIEDVSRCRQIGCCGVIIGRAYYEGRIDLKEALELAAAEG